MSFCFQTLLFSWMCLSVSAWMTVTTIPSSPSQGNVIASRRDWLQRVAVVGNSVVAGVSLTPEQAVAAFDTERALQELEQSIEKMKPIPDLLDANEWDKVRSILKVPPVNKLWNLGDSQNILLQIARETDNMELLELKDDLAYNLQLCDQLTYDNSFRYFQPGNGKLNIKEPKDLAQESMKQIQQAIDLAKQA